MDPVPALVAQCAQLAIVDSPECVDPPDPLPALAEQCASLSLGPTNRKTTSSPRSSPSALPPAPPPSIPSPPRPASIARRATAYEIRFIPARSHHPHATKEPSPDPLPPPPPSSSSPLPPPPVPHRRSHSADALVRPYAAVIASQRRADARVTSWVIDQRISHAAANGAEPASLPIFTVRRAKTYRHQPYAIRHIKHGNASPSSSGALTPVGKRSAAGAVGRGGGGVTIEMKILPYFSPAHLARPPRTQRPLPPSSDFVSPQQVFGLPPPSPPSRSRHLSVPELLYLRQLHRSGAVGNGVAAAAAGVRMDIDDGIEEAEWDDGSPRLMELEDPGSPTSVNAAFGDSSPDRRAF
ncbi:hypothetical protein HDU89_008007 [Geranomyces variabilis]|nr:hypothetical protein HDU89_008007 [Geranomyces variabilis]